MMCLGMFWYSPSGFGKQWMAAIGIKWPTDKKKQEEMKKKGAEGMKTAIPLSILGNILTAVVMSLLITYTGMTTLKGGLFIGFLAWLGFQAPRWGLNTVLWEGRPWTLYFINVAHELVGLLIMGAILGAWQ